MEYIGWNFMPHNILVDVFLLLSPCDRFHASLTCRSWNTCFYIPRIWSKFLFQFIVEQNSNHLQSIEKFGSYMKTVHIELNQYHPFNRAAACKVLSAIAKLPERRLQRLKIQFVGENPCLYAGQEFIVALCELFGPAQEDVCIVHSLQHVDLSDMHVAFTGELLDLLSENNPLLETLNIQNKVLICQVQSSDTFRFVERCRRLQELCIYNYSLSEDVLLAFTADDRAPLEHLSLYFRREDKFSRDIPADIWKKVTHKLPHLRVTLGFDHTCPLCKVSEVMQPEIPVHVLRLQTFTSLEYEIRLACAYYQNTLEKLVANPVRCKSSQELDEVLIDLSSKCSKLRTLHIFCQLNQATVETIFAQHPDMVRKNTYTLKYVETPHPWIAGFDS